MYAHGPLRERATTYLQGLVRIPSVNPGLVPSGAGEAAIAHHICGLMAAWGLEVEEHEFAPGRPNAIGILRGSGGGRALLFNGHTDTVGTAGMAGPFSGEIRDGKLFGRGAIDMKASLAATLAATEAIVGRGDKLRGDVVFTYVGDEEHVSLGTEGIVADVAAGRLPRPAGAINTEPTGVRLGIGHRGYAWIEIETRGRAAHGSRPDLGVDAIAHMGRVLAQIERLQARLAEGPRHPLLGTGSVHASLIQGGRELSTYPDSCTLAAERRTVPPESGADVAEEFSAILRGLAGDDPQFSGTSRVTFVRDPWEANPASEVVQMLGRSVAGVTGRPAESMVHSAWLDASLLGQAGIPTVVLGPAGDGLHAAEEWVDLDSVGTCAQIYADVIEQFCG
jgi:acetylornithine deacetylase